jgi:hypothetical protein
VGGQGWRVVFQSNFVLPVGSSDGGGGGGGSGGLCLFVLFLLLLIESIE